MLNANFMPKIKLKKVLIVEDDVVLVNIYSKKFSNEGYDVISAADGKRGLALAKAKKPDMVLLDLMLPLMGGFEVLEKIKKDDSLKDMPVILLTNLNDCDGIKRGYNLGASDYVIKSFFTPAEVVEKVNKYIK